MRHGEASGLKEVRQTLEDNRELLGHGPGAVLHAIVDQVVDDYLPAIEGLDEDIEEVEDEVFSPAREQPGRAHLQAQARGARVPPRHGAAGGARRPAGAAATTSWSTRRSATYFRDVNDHLLRVSEPLEGYRELLTAVLQANLAQVSVRQNEDVRKISAWVAILAVPTMLAGIYGMNFEHMPELGWSFGYPLVLGVMAVICLGLFRYFKRSRLAVASSLARRWQTTASSARSPRATGPGEIVQEDEHTVAFMDINPWTRGHALVIPRNHSPTSRDRRRATWRHTMAAAKRLAGAHEGRASAATASTCSTRASRPPGRRSSTSTCT